MRGWSAEQLAEAAGARLVEPGTRTSGPTRAVIDSRHAGPGDLFVGLPGERVDGGRFAEDVLGAGAWGVLVGEG
ncbi:MAG: UDP-N-acetylmuramoyl-tripeptide--D-alanyl-D-alanine ligase, partial [Baekduia sp.]|nr:UDP-N-acetylmuramoyl-tripeptide--D-alanyl-D-alanine ligase [Baekduia sp.]